MDTDDSASEASSVHDDDLYLNENPISPTFNDDSVEADGKEVDIYGNIETPLWQVAELQGKIAFLEDGNRHLQSKVDTLSGKETALIDLEARYAALKKECKTLKSNLDSLLTTSKVELNRKEKLLTEARKARDDIMFRRGRSKTNDPVTPQNGITTLSDPRIINKPNEKGVVFNNISFTAIQEQGPFSRKLSVNCSRVAIVYDTDKPVCDENNLPTNTCSNVSNVPAPHMPTSVVTVAEQLEDKYVDTVDQTLKNMFSDNPHTATKIVVPEMRNSLSENNAVVKEKLDAAANIFKLPKLPVSKGTNNACTVVPSPCISEVQSSASKKSSVPKSKERTRPKKRIYAELTSPGEPQKIVSPLKIVMSKKPRLSSTSGKKKCLKDKTVLSLFGPSTPEDKNKSKDRNIRSTNTKAKQTPLDLLHKEMLHEQSHRDQTINEDNNVDHAKNVDTLTPQLNNKDNGYCELSDAESGQISSPDYGNEELDQVIARRVNMLTKDVTEKRELADNSRMWRFASPFRNNAKNQSYMRQSAIRCVERSRSVVRETDKAVQDSRDNRPSKFYGSSRDSGTNQRRKSYGDNYRKDRDRRSPEYLSRDAFMEEAFGSRAKEHLKHETRTSRSTRYHKDEKRKNSTRRSSNDRTLSSYSLKQNSRKTR